LRVKFGEKIESFPSSKVWERGFGFKIGSKGFNLDGILIATNQN
jgi:hypothetical protein